VKAEEDVDSYIKNASLSYQLIVDSSREAAVEWFKSHPEESKRRLVHKDEKSRRHLPLHEACIQGARVMPYWNASKAPHNSASFTPFPASMGAPLTL
jgi:hypothetical protein